MSTQTNAPSLSRRDQAIAHAADLLRESGPRALTSGAVAARMGITQSAVYRHIRNIDELSAMAAAVVVAELNDALAGILLDPTIDWDHIDDVAELCRALIAQVMKNERALFVVDQWRFVGGDLGSGVERVINDGVRVVAALLESRWRNDFRYDAPLSASAQQALRAHAYAMHDDGHAVARLTRSSETMLGVDDVADLLRYRILAGWAAFVADMNERTGLPFAEFDLQAGVVVR